MSKICILLREALITKIEFIDTLDILQQLSVLVKEELNSYIHLLAQPIFKGSFMK